MKRETLIAIFVILLLFSCNIKKDNDLQKWGVKGNVKTITETKYNVEERFGKKEKGEQRSIVIERYNEEGMLTEGNIYSSLETETPSAYKMIYDYNKEGKMLGLSRYDKEGQLTDKVINQYDTRGDLIQEDTYDPDGKLRYTSIMKYNDRGNMTERLNYHGQDKILIGKDVFKYDNENRTTEIENYLQNGSKLEFNSKTTFDRNDKNQVVKIINSGVNYKSPNISTFSYEEEDKEGNWIKEIEYFESKATNIVLRTLDYY